MGKKTLKNYKKKQKEESIIIKDVDKILQFYDKDYNKAIKHCYDNNLYDSFLKLYNEYNKIQEEEEFQEEKLNMKVEESSLETYIDITDYIDRTMVPLCQHLESQHLDELFYVFLNK